jgi:transposase-like protein
MAREAREVWAKRVERLADSGLTAKEYAAEIGVNANTLAGWRWRLRPGRLAPVAEKVAEPVGVTVHQDGRGQVASRRDPPATTGATTRQAVTPMKFVELTTAPAARRVVFEIVLRSGVTVRVPGGFDAGELVRLVDVLEEARS